MIRESQKRPKKIRLWENSQTDIGIRESQISCEIGGESVSIHPAGAYADEDKPFAGSDINTQINGIWQYQRGDTRQCIAAGISMSTSAGHILKIIMV
jgi:hypothetical protein